MVMVFLGPTPMVQNLVFWFSIYSALWIWSMDPVRSHHKLYETFLISYLHINYCFSDSRIIVTGGKFELNGTTSVPKSVPRLVVDKARLLFWSEVV